MRHEGRCMCVLLRHCRGEVLRLGEQLRLQQPLGAWPATPGVPEPRSVLQGQLLAQFSALMATPPCGFSELVTKASDSWEYLDEEESNRGALPGRRLAGSPSRVNMVPRGRCEWRGARPAHMSLRRCWLPLPSTCVCARLLVTAS